MFDVKVLQVNNFNYLRGGSDRIFAETCTGLHARGLEVVRFTPEGVGPAAEDLDSMKPKAIDLDRPALLDYPRYFHNVDAAQKLQKLIDKYDGFDVAHLHIYHGRISASILPVLRRNKIPIVHTLHEYKILCPVYTMHRNNHFCALCATSGSHWATLHRCKGGSLVKSLAATLEHEISKKNGTEALVDRYVCISQFQQKLCEDAGIAKEKLNLIYNFVDHTMFFPDAAPASELYFLYYGRIEKIKGIELLINVFRRSRHRLKIMGAGAFLPQALDLARGASNITFHSPESDRLLRQTISSSFAVVVPSEWQEPFGLTVIEAKACGVPVIGSNAGAIPELIAEGVDGFIFEAGNANSLSASIEAMLVADRFTMGKKALNDVRERFALGRYLDTLVGLFEELVEVQ